MSDALSREQYCETVRDLMTMAYPARAHLVKVLRDHDAALRTSRAEQTARAEAAERKLQSDRSVWASDCKRLTDQVSDLTEKAEVAETSSLREIHNTIAALAARDAYDAERRLLKQQVSDLTAKLEAAGEDNRIKADLLDIKRKELAAMTQERDKWVGHAESIGTDRHQIQLAHDALQQQITAAQDELKAHQRSDELLHFIVEHDDGDFERPQEIEEEAMLYGIENVLKMKRALTSAQDEAKGLREALDGCFMLATDALLSRETVTEAIVAIYKKQDLTPPVTP